MSVRSILWLLLAATLALGATGCDGHAAAVRKVEAVGAPRLAEAAESLRRSSQGSLPLQLPEEAWPRAIRALAPEIVIVEEKGVFVQMRSFFVRASGVFIGFPGSEPPVERSGDPWFKRISGRVYWYEIAG